MKKPKESEKLRTIGVSPELIERMEQRERIEEESGDTFVIIAEGLCFATVCSSLGKEVTERRMASIYSGTRNGWTLSDENFDADSPNGLPCNEKPETHRHYLFAA